MNGFRFPIAVVLCCLTGASLASAESQSESTADPRENLATAVPEAIRLLEAKEHRKFIESFVAPADLKKVLEKGSLDDLVKGFGERKADRLLQFLTAIKSEKPMLDPSGTKATYEAKEPIGGKTRLEWEQVDKYWYIRN